MFTKRKRGIHTGIACITLAVILSAIYLFSLFYFSTDASKLQEKSIRTLSSKEDVGKEDIVLIKQVTKENLEVCFIVTKTQIFAYSYIKSPFYGGRYTDWIAGASSDQDMEISLDDSPYRTTILAGAAGHLPPDHGQRVTITESDGRKEQTRTEPFLIEGSYYFYVYHEKYQECNKFRDFSL